MNTRCCVQVYGSGPPYIGYGCTKPVRIEIDGKHYCAIHNPETVSQRKEKTRLRWNADNEKKRQKYAAQDEQVRRAACYDDLLAAVLATQFGFNHRRCPVCAGFNVGPNGETDKVHTKDCIVGLAIKKATQP